MVARNYNIELEPTLDEGVFNLRTAFANAFEPPPELTITEWADDRRKLPRVSSSEHGQWRTSRFPFLKQIMDDLSPQSPHQEVVVMKGAQLGFTEVAMNMMLYNVDYHPCPMLYVQKTLGAVEKFSKQRFGPSVEAMPTITETLGSQKGRDSSNTMLLKSWPGGIIIMGGANSASSLRSMPIEVLILDEWDSFEQDIQSEGDPAELAIRRTANFPRRKVFYLSTPVLKELSRIEPAFEAGTQCWYEVPCPECGKLQRIMWKNIKFEHTESTVHSCWLECQHCQKPILEKHKTWMLDPENGARWVARNPEARYPSYHLSSLYSPLGFYSWTDAVELFLRATMLNDKDLLKVFVNTVLGEPWSEKARTVAAAGLMKRREEYKALVPDGVKVLTAGVDVQDDRIEVEVVGWGRRRETWSIDYAVFRGDTESVFVWEQLDDFLRMTWEHERGMPVNLSCVMIDSGHRARVVYNFCRLREHRNVFPIKGVTGWGKGYINRPTKRNKDKVYLFNVYPDEVKDAVYSLLRIEEPGPGYCHFPLRPEYAEDYFKMLTAERLVSRRVRGFTRLEWELPKGHRNEALDCRVYAMAGLNVLNPNFDVIDQKGGVMSLTKGRARKRGRVISQGV
jgi:phage terminase large subunit GpA-like protein